MIKILIPTATQYFALEEDFYNGCSHCFRVHCCPPPSNFLSRKIRGGRMYHKCFNMFNFTVCFILKGHPTPDRIQSRSDRLRMSNSVEGAPVSHTSPQSVTDRQSEPVRPLANPRPVLAA